MYKSVFFHVLYKFQLIYNIWINNVFLSLHIYET